MDDEKLNNEEEEFDIEIIDEVEDEKEDNKAKTSQEVAEPETYSDESQSVEDNSKFASMRKKHEAEIAELKAKYETPSKSDDEIISELAFNENITYDEAKNLYNKDKELKSMKEELKELKKNQRKQSINNDLNKFTKKPHFKLIEVELTQMIENNPDVDINTAYNFLVGQNIDKILNSKTKEDTQEKAKKRTVSTGNGNVSKTKVTMSKSDMDYIKSRVDLGIFKNFNEGIKALKAYDE